MSKNTFLSEDWNRLAYVEMASGIEVLYVAKYFRNHKSTHRVLLEHVLDEYRHGAVFRRLESTRNSWGKLTTNHKLLTLGGLEKSRTYRNKNLTDMCSYLYIGEMRSIRFIDSLDLTRFDVDTRKQFNGIRLDEERHASGVNKYLKNKLKFKVAFYKAKHHLAYGATKARAFKVTAKFREFTEILIVKGLAKLLTRGLTDIASSKISLASALKSKNALL